MPYVKTPINPGDILDPTWGNKVQEQYDEAIEDITIQDPWVPVSFKNGFQNIGTNYRVASVMKDTLGFVHVFMRIGNNTNGSGIAATVPVAFRPANSEPIVYMAQGVDGSKTISDCVIYPNGEVQLWGYKDSSNLIRGSYYIGN